MSVIAKPAALTLNQITKTFSSGTEAVAETTLSIGAGQFVAVVGPSGCGKSTLLRMVAGLSAPTSGEITGQSDGESDIGFVFQEPTLMPWATVSDNVALPLVLKNADPRSYTDNVTNVLDWVGLSDFRNAYPRELSGGMKMRVSIARALVSKPHLLLLDEPFAALDEFTRAALNDDLLRLWEEQKWTALFVTHSVREAAFLADRILVMSPRPGRIVADMAVPFDHPRRPALRDSHDYSDFCVSVSQALHQGESRGEDA